MAFGKTIFGSFDRRIWILFYGRIISATGFSIVIPFLSIYLYTNLHVSMVDVGMIFLASSAIGAFGQIIGGEVCDRIGRRKVMFTAMGLRSIVFLALGYVIAAGYGYFDIAILIIMSSFVGSLFDPASNAMVADVVEPSKRLEAYGLLRIGQNIGWTLGPLIGGLLAIISYASLFVLTAITSATVAFIIMFLIVESVTCPDKSDRFHPRDLGHVLANPIFLGFCVTTAFVFLVMAQMSSVFSVFSENVVGIPINEVGYLYAINGLIVVFFQMPVARFLSHYRMTSTLMIGSAVYAIGYFSVAFAEDFYFLAVSMVVISVGEIITSPSSMNLVANLSPEKERGRYMGVFGLFTNFGWSMGPLVGGILMDSYVKTPIFLWAGVAAFAGIGIVGFALIRRKISESYDRVGGRPRAAHRNH
jgi:MFS family permease